MKPLHKPGKWISIMRRHWNGLLPAFPFLQDVMSSELKNKILLALWFTHQEEDIALQVDYLTSLLHLRHNIFTLY